MYLKITNPLHYISANNPEGTIELLRSYGFSNITTDAHLAHAVDHTAHHPDHGVHFVRQMNEMHPDRELLLDTLLDSKITDSYKVSFGAATLDAVKAELASLNAQLNVSGIDPVTQANIQEKIQFLQSLAVYKSQSTTSSPADALSNLHKTNQWILIGIAAALLMFFGSKIFKHD